MLILKIKNKYLKYMVYNTSRYWYYPTYQLFLIDTGIQVFSNCLKYKQKQIKLACFNKKVYSILNPSKCYRFVIGISGYQTCFDKSLNFQLAKNPLLHFLSW